MENQLPEQTKKKKMSGWKIALIVLLVVLFVFLATCAAIGYYAMNAIRPLEEEEPREVSIASGTSTVAIANQLEEDGIIRNKYAFLVYLRYKNQDGRLQAGNYELNPGMTLDEVIDKLSSGDIIQVREEGIRFTIPEGYTVLQIADKLEQEGLINKEVFLELAEDRTRWPTEWTAHIPEDEEIRFRLEGYLFPETYEMRKGSSEYEIIARMILEWDRKRQQLPDDWEQQLEQSGLTFHELLTIASLIEREVVVDDERPVVAGIIYNRLNINMALQIDATVQYLFDEPRERVLYSDLEIDSPYNTYRNTGIPPGPIASPGLASIKAALWPEETDYFFYVTKKDGTGRHYFSVTYQEHLANDALSRQQGTE